jgi:hypothetical protein
MSEEPAAWRSSAPSMILEKLSLSITVSDDAVFFLKLRATSPKGVSPVSSCALSLDGSATRSSGSSSASFQRVGVSGRTNNQRPGESCPPATQAGNDIRDRGGSQVLTEIVLRASPEAEVTSGTLVTGTSLQKKDWARADEMEAQRGARPTWAPNFPKEDPKSATATLDPPLVAAGTPNGPPQSPEPRNTDA